MYTARILAGGSRMSGFRVKIFIATCLAFWSIMVFHPDPIAAKTKTAADPASCIAKPLVNKEYFPALLQAVDDAKEEICIAVFSFKAGIHPKSYPDVLVEHLGKAVRRGVPVWVLLETSANREDSLTKQNLKTKQLLEEKGVKVYLDSPRKTTHTKLVIIDRRLLFIGSHNFTSSAFRHNNEISIFMDRPDLAQKVRDYILTLIKEAQ